MSLIKNICIFDTPYTLLLYLLEMPMVEIERTKFITCSSLHSSVIDKLPNKCLRYYGFDIGNDWKKLLEIRLKRFYEYPFIAWSNIYAQDHLRISAQVIGRKRYTLLADGPLYLYNYSKRTRRAFGGGVIVQSVKDCIKFMLAYGGTIFTKEFGKNDQCANRWVTTKQDMELVSYKGLKCTFIDMEGVWKESSSQKQEYILDVFDISQDLCKDIHKIEVLILTQPFREDCGLTDEEYLAIYRPIIEKNKNVVIKPHPRDKFDFQKFFPSLPILRTYAPMQLLSFIGLKPNIAVTVSSTSLSDMPDEVEKVFLGTKVNNKIFNVYGDLCN